MVFSNALTEEWILLYYFFSPYDWFLASLCFRWKTGNEDIFVWMLSDWLTLNQVRRWVFIFCQLILFMKQFSQGFQQFSLIHMKAEICFCLLNGTKLYIKKSMSGCVNKFTKSRGNKRNNPFQVIVLFLYPLKISENH